MMRLLVLLAVVGLALCDRVHFDGDKGFRVTPKDEDQVKLLQQLQLDENLDFWTDLVHPGIATDIHVTSSKVVEVADKLKEWGVAYTVIIEDLEKEVKEEEEELKTNNYQFS